MVSNPVPLKVGDEVLFNAGGKWFPAEVRRIRPNGELMVIYADGVMERAQHGPGQHCWLTYAEAAESLKQSAHA